MTGVLLRGAAAFGAAKATTGIGRGSGGVGVTCAAGAADTSVASLRSIGSAVPRLFSLATCSLAKSSISPCSSRNICIISGEAWVT